jgi:hypothetical protein
MFHACFCFHARPQLIIYCFYHALSSSNRTRVSGVETETNQCVLQLLVTLSFIPSFLSQLLSKVTEKNAPLLKEILILGGIDKWNQGRSQKKV